MIKSEKSYEIEAPVEAVFAYILDPENVPEYETTIHEVKDLQRLPNGGYAYTAVARGLGLHVDFKCEHVEVIPNERIVEKMQGGGMHGTTTQCFEQLEGGKTRVSTVSETSLHAGPLAKFGESFFAKYLDHDDEMAMQAAKALIEAKVIAATPR